MAAAFGGLLTVAFDRHLDARQAAQSLGTDHQYPVIVIVIDKQDSGLCVITGSHCNNK